MAKTLRKTSLKIQILAGNNLNQCLGASSQETPPLVSRVIDIHNILISKVGSSNLDVSQNSNSDINIFTLFHLFQKIGRTQKSKKLQSPCFGLAHFQNIVTQHIHITLNIRAHVRGSEGSGRSLKFWGLLLGFFCNILKKIPPNQLQIFFRSPNFKKLTWALLNIIGKTLQLESSTFVY